MLGVFRRSVHIPAGVGGHFACLHAHCEHRSDADFKDAIGYIDEEALADFTALATSPVESAPTADTPRNRFAAVPAAEFAVLQSAPWIIKHILPKAEMALIYGDSGSGKTFQVLDLAGAVARGANWRGHKTNQGRVVYVAAEGANGCRRRLLAYAKHHELNLKDVPIFVIPHAPNLLLKTDAVEVAKAILAVGGADLVIMDTLAQTMPGGNENGGDDMSLALTNCKGIHRATGALVLIVHHSGKDSTKGARGWSGLRAAADMEMEVARCDDDRVLTITKQKDGEEGEAFGFTLQEVLLGLDEDGEAITSCAVQYSSAKDIRKKASREPKGAVEKLVMRLFKDNMDLADGTVHELALLGTAVDQLPFEEGKRDTRRQRILRAIESLLSSGTLSRDKGQLSLID